MIVVSSKPFSRFLGPMANGAQQILVRRNDIPHLDGQIEEFL
jgi:hypothetical protein